MERVHYINAGAGAGKTTTLVKELRRILTEKDANGNYLCQPSEIILTTYTKAAAKEFREKTFKKLLEAPAALDVAKILDTATIGTVHSVAEQYLQRYWSLLGYSGQFNVMSDTDKEIYINRSLRELVDEQDIQFFNEYVDLFKVSIYKNKVIKNNYNFWKEYVIEIISQMHSYNIGADQLPIFCKKSCNIVRKLFNVTYNKTTVTTYANDVYTELCNTNSIQATNKVKLYNDFILLSVPTEDQIRQFLDSGFFSYQAKDSSAKSSLNNTKEYLKTSWTMSPTSGNKVQECIKRIFDIAIKWAIEFDNYKRENNLLDFDDLEAKFLDLLGIEAVREDIKSSVKYLFVDEFQDSNPIQLEIFQKLSDLVQIKSFWVGDPKQAIYGFRGSDSSLTTKLLKSFPKPELKKSPNYTFKPNSNQCTAELINTSWRSIKSLAQLSNEVFKLAFKKGVPTECIKQVPLRQKRNDKKIQYPIQHWHCVGGKYNALATRVSEILNGKCGTISGVYEEESPWHWRKKIIPSDIAILTSTNDTCADIAEALRNKNIPVALAETDIRDKAEVKLVLALLKYVAKKNRKYAKAELSKLLEDKKFETILADIAKGRYDFIPFKEDKDLVGQTDAQDNAAASNTTSAQSSDDKDPDSFFAMLDDKLNCLRGLNISAIVKGVIAVLDLRNVVAKWKMADIRRENLDMLIAQATAFELSNAHTPDSATVSDFIDYIQKVKIEAQLDQSADGVKVATYHKSKGLQWKIVILDSLTRDELDDKKFVKNNWFGLNLKGGYNAAELQLIPSIGDINDSMAGMVADLSVKNRDNGYYNLRHGKVEGELKRLLYVGVTRARDYLITISLDNKPLKWVQNVRQDTFPSKTDVLENIANQTSSSYIDLWGVPQHQAWYEQISDNLAVTYKKASARATKLKEVPMSTVTEHKRISPSGSKEEYENATPTLVDGFKSPYIAHSSKIDDYAAFGTCIHNYMAAHRWEGKNKINDNKQSNIDLARQTVGNHNLKKELPQPELLTQAADALFSYLEETFGAGELLRETPFSYRRSNGQLVVGEIDLIWKTDKECILLDYKNFPAEKSYGQKVIFNDTPNNEHYVGHYFPQLGDYRAALTAAGMNVTHVFIFYAVLGCLVEIEF